MSAYNTISEAIGNDHKLLDSYAENIKSSSTLQEQTEWRNQFTWALARHAISEELTMYPAMEKHMGQEGIDLTNVDREQHQAVSNPRAPIQIQLTLIRSKKISSNSKASRRPPVTSSHSLSVS